MGGAPSRISSASKREGAALTELRDEVVPDGALETLEIELFGFLPLGLSAYAEVLATLGAGGYRDEDLGLAGAIDYGSDHYTCFQYDYDWRRDLAGFATNRGASGQRCSGILRRHRMPCLCHMQ